MPSPTRTAVGELDALRARTLAELEHQLELQRIEPAEFERRSEQAIEAGSALELRPLVADLVASDPPLDPPTDPTPRSTSAAPPAARATNPAPHPPPHPAPSVRRASEPDHEWTVAIMSGSNRSGVWDPAENVTVLSIMGGVRLDFREAAFLEGVVTKVSVFCLMGGCDIIVPPDIHVSVAGTGLLGGFGHVAQTAPHADAPRLHIAGLAFMGGVEIKVRPPDDEDEEDG